MLCLVLNGNLSVPTQRALCFTLLWFCKPIACNSLTWVAEPMTGSRLKSCWLFSQPLLFLALHIYAAGIYINLLSLRTLLQLRRLGKVPSWSKGQVWELCHFDISIVGISGTRWLCEGVGQTCSSRWWACVEKWRCWHPLELCNGCSLEELLVVLESN